MPFTYARTVRLADTDAAGVMFFARTLAVCHEAYEESLAASGISLASLLGGEVIVPISKSEADYLRPLRVGDKLRVTAAPEFLSDKSFAIRFEIHRLGAIEKLAARVRTEHVCTSPAKRERVSLPPALLAWVQAR
jgi:1,4-dihydroxy-2-naphthoyl-CoA hydrolase